MHLTTGWKPVRRLKELDIFWTLSFSEGGKRTSETDKKMDGGKKKKAESVCTMSPKCNASGSQDQFKVKPPGWTVALFLL